MDVSRLTRQVRILQVYAALSTILLALALWAAFRAPPRARFSEVDVQRINVIEPDGKLRMIITSASRSLQDHRPPEAGMIFFNSDGQENGGLGIEGGRTRSGAVDHGLQLSLDRYDQDQTVVLRHRERDGKYFSGLFVQDRPATSIRPLARRAAEIRAMPPGPARDAARADLIKQGGPAPVRLLLGRDYDRSSTIALSDGQGRPRIRMTVSESGEARLEFLDEQGGVLARYPEGQPR
jgi:hypothetical protein